MDDEFKDLQRLLSIKRHEAPPPEYFEDFLFEFQQRQRAEMLKRPLWRLALDRFEGAMPNFSFPRYAYASASAMAVAAAVVVSGHIVATPRPVAASGELASVKAAGLRPLAPVGLRVASSQKFDFDTSQRSFRLPEMDFDHPRPTAASYVKSSRTRYVLDTQPVSYEQPSSF